MLMESIPPGTLWRLNIVLLSVRPSPSFGAAPSREPRDFKKDLLNGVRTVTEKVASTARLITQASLGSGCMINEEALHPSPHSRWWDLSASCLWGNCLHFSHDCCEQHRPPVDGL
jgi:hypothetical protein